MLIQISENSAAVTPYGSLAQVYRNVGNSADHAAVLPERFQSKWCGAGFAL
jgi:hypothetical protein